MDVLLQHQQYLVGVHWLDEVIGYLLPDGLFHNVLLLTLGHHHHGRGWCQFLDALQRLQPAEPRHLLIEQHQVEAALLAKVNGIGAIAARGHFITFLFQKNDVGLEQFHFIIDPQ